MPTITFSCTEQDRRRLATLRKQTGISQSALCRLALREMLRRPDDFLAQVLQSAQDVVTNGHGPQ